MPENRGKKFEQVIWNAFLKVDGVSIDRLHDQTNGYAGSSNICDFIVYKKPYEYYIECKSIHGNTLSIYGNDPKKKYGNITNKQWEGLLEKSNVPGVFAGIICWWVDKDKTYFLPIQNLRVQREEFEKKSIGLNYILDSPRTNWIEIKGKKKRVFFDYDMDCFFRAIEQSKGGLVNESVR